MDAKSWQSKLKHAGAPSVHVHLELLADSVLQISIRRETGQLSCTKQDLNLYLGNDDGAVSANGENFSYSARNVRLEEYALHAELKSRNGSWQPDKIGLDIELPSARNGYEVRLKAVEYHVSHTPNCRDNSTRLCVTEQDHLRDLRLYAECLLAADCRQANGTHATSYVNLDRYLGNDNGRLMLGRRNFSRSAHNVKLSGTTLLARVSRPGGHRTQSAVDVSRVVRCGAGRLVPYLVRKPEDCDSPYHVDNALPIEEPLPKCLRLRLIDGSVVLGECQTTAGDYRMSSFNLDRILGFAGGRFRLFGDNFADKDDRGRTAGLEGSVFTAHAAHHTGEFPARVDGYRTDSIDLKGILEVVDGWLALRKDGNSCSGCAGLFRAGVLYSLWGEKVSKPDPGVFNKQSIPPAHLPRTYKGAIATCRLLGLCYLWIDSLCILQNSEEDWLRESPKVMDYYGQCYICITATNVSGPNAGLHIRDRPTALRAAGVLQERWLAPRTLHFCGAEVVFECAQGLECECGRNNETFTLWKGDPTKVMPIEN
ncbi:hypothetical protein LTR08_009272 [Meristemomyces frigidus]|nr:hypothetical protein LTR08_009272 [Meristemomyces frigidus]